MTILPMITDISTVNIFNVTGLKENETLTKLVDFLAQTHFISFILTKTFCLVSIADTINQIG